MEFISLLVILILTFLLRALPWILRITGESSDQFYHFLWAEKIRENKFKCPKRAKGFLLPGIYDYPPLFHYLLALFSRNKREQLAPFFSAIIDTIHVLVIYTFILYVAQTPEFAIYIPNPSLTACVAALLFATSPSLLYHGVGPRAFHATPRTLGELFFTVSFLFGCIYYLQESLLALFLSCIFAGLVFLTSKFGSQVMIFFSIILALFLQSLFFITLPVFGLIAALALSRGHYRKVFIGGIKHSLHIRNTLHRTFLKYRNNPSEFKNIISNIKKKDFIEFSRSCLRIITDNTYVILVIRNAMLFGVFYLVLKQLEFATTNNVLFFLFSWIVASLIIFFLTSLRPFLFLGEAERYIEHSVPAQVILLSVLFTFTSPSIHLMLIALLTYHGLFYAANIALIYGVYKSSYSGGDDKEELFNWLTTEAVTGKKILTIPDTDHNELVYKTDNAVLFPPANFTLITEDLFNDLWGELPWPTRDLQRLIESYGLDIIIVNKKQIDYSLKRGWYYDLSPYTKVHENNVYVVYQTAQ